VSNKSLPRKTQLEMTHVDKGWGWERWICNGPEYCGKLLFFNEGKRCSWHVHRLKDEVFYLQSGKMVVYYSENDDLESANEVFLEPGDSFHVYRGLRHQMLALQDSELFEFSTQHFDSDSYRIIKGD
jgi:mannose-6-phosphate isomerase-like protein (cupin superfamily)